MPLVRAEVRDKKPGTHIERLEWVTRYIVEIKDPNAGNIVITAMDKALGTSRLAHGVYRTSYTDVRAALQLVLDQVPEPKTVAQTAKPICYVLAILLGTCFIASRVVLIPFWLLSMLFLGGGSFTNAVFFTVAFRVTDTRDLIRRLLA